MERKYSKEKLEKCVEKTTRVLINILKIFFDKKNYLLLC